MAQVKRFQALAESRNAALEDLRATLIAKEQEVEELHWTVRLKERGESFGAEQAGPGSHCRVRSGSKLLGAGTTTATR